MPGKDPIIIAHRGASGYLPEHTLAAKAMAHAMGADFLEQDVVLSNDGVPIVLHDIYLDSTTDVAQHYPQRARADGRYYAIDFSLQEIRQLRVHERCQPLADGSRQAVYPQRFPLGEAMFSLPTLAEEIALIRGLNRSRGCRTGLYLEIKAPNWHLLQGQDITAAVMAVLQQLDVLRQDRLYLQCFDPGTLRRLRQEFGVTVPLIQLIGEQAWGEDTEANFEHMRSPEGLDQLAAYADGIGPWLLHILGGRDTRGNARFSDLVAEAHARGLLVHPYTARRDELPESVNSLQELLTLLLDEAGVDGLFTDFPDVMRQHLDLHKQ